MYIGQKSDSKDWCLPLPSCFLPLRFSNSECKSWIEIWYFSYGDRSFSWTNVGYGDRSFSTGDWMVGSAPVWSGYSPWVKFRFWGLVIEVEGVLAMEIGASAGPTLAMEIGASVPGIEWLGQCRWDRGILCGSTPVLGGYWPRVWFWGKFVTRHIWVFFISNQ